MKLEGTYRDPDLADRIMTTTLCMTRQCWEQGMLAYACQFCGEKGLLQHLVQDMLVREGPDGRLCVVENTRAVTDSAFCLVPALAVSDASVRTACGRNLDFLRTRAERSAEGILYHVAGTQEIWADSAAFLPMAFALDGDMAEALRQMRGITACLSLSGSRLFGHIRCADGTWIDRRPWGVGNGWILTGLLRLIRVMRRHGEDTREMEAAFRDLMQAMLETRDAQGRFHNDLSDFRSFADNETAAMVAIALLQGIREGLLDSSCRGTAESIHACILSDVDADGYVRNSCGSPRFDRSGTSVESQAHMLMLEHLLTC